MFLGTPRVGLYERREDVFQRVGASFPYRTINAIHQDVKHTKAMTDGIKAEIADLAKWLNLPVEAARAP